jgi:hypothetical protein
VLGRPRAWGQPRREAVRWRTLRRVTCATCPLERVAEPAHARAARSIALLSGLVWLLIAFAPLPGIGAIERWLLLAVLVLVPLSLSLLPAVAQRLEALPLRLALPLLLVGEPTVLASFATPQGAGAALLCVPWLVVAVLLALHGLARLVRLRPGRPDEACLSFGLLYLTVGAVFLCLARLGAAPLGFPPVIVLLTAVHFHYAGLLAPVIAAQVGRATLAGRPGLWRVYRPLALGVIAGPPLVGLGITLSRPLEIVGVLVLVLALGGLALLTLALLSTVRPWLVRPLLLVSALALLGGLLLAASYGLGHPATHVAAPAALPGVPTLGIPDMVGYHGPLQALGFVLCGLLGWTLVQAWAALPATEAERMSQAALTAGAAPADAPAPAGDAELLEIPTASGEIEQMGMPGAAGHTEDVEASAPRGREGEC